MRWLLSSMLSKPVTWLLHIALTTILVGACVTHFFGEQGEIHLRADKAETIHVKQHALTLFLWSFEVTEADYIAELRILDRSRAPLVVDEGTARINKPLKYHGFRFCLSDYDSDEMGVVLAYNYDPWGIGITYTGYALLLISMVGFFFQKHSLFRTLLNQSVFGQRSGLFSVCAVVIIMVLTFVMTKAVTPKPPLQPVLQTPLLGIHVSVIMLAYTLFAVMMVNGILGLCVTKWRKKLMLLSQVLLYPAEFCLIVGIFVGAVWANMSWGRYWGWDPKETWALVTMLVYALLLHFPWMKKLLAKSDQHQKSEKIYHILSIVAFLFVLFTYFGVSYLLGGLHSYS